MKFRLHDPIKWRRFFAVLPHDCNLCGIVFWLEHGYKRTVAYTPVGSIYDWRCSACKPS